MSEATGPEWGADVCLLAFGSNTPDVVTRGLQAFLDEHLPGAKLVRWLRSGMVSIFAAHHASLGTLALRVHHPASDVPRLHEVARVQTHLAAAGLPVPRPVVTVSPMGSGWGSIEQFLAPEGRATSWRADLAEPLGEMLGRVVKAAADARPKGLGQRDLLVRVRQQALVADPQLAEQAVAVVAAADCALVPTHGDWRLGNVAAVGRTIKAVYDLDSLTFAPEPVGVGCAAAMQSLAFLNDFDVAAGMCDEAVEKVTVAQLVTFTRGYEGGRQRPLDDQERVIAGAAATLVLLAGTYFGGERHELERLIAAGL